VTRSRIRVAREDDGASAAAIYQPFVETSVISFEAAPPDSSEMSRRIVDTVADFPWLICEIGGRAAGYAYATRHRVRAAYLWSVDTSVYVDRQYWRLGIGRGLYASLFAILAAQGFYNAYAGITLPNPASVALHEAAGFKPVGVYRRVGFKHDGWHDVGWWELTLQAHSASPQPPLALAALRSRPEWESLVASGEPFIRPTAAIR
jgi:L-amino acid N-acyltransferase YncA